MKLTVQDIAMFYGCMVKYESVSEYFGRFRNYKVGSIYCLKAQILEGIQQEHIFKPILRPLSDMTETEKREVEGCLMDDYEFGFLHKPFTVKYLISKHFDVFGWIEKGLAISKV
jgi:hypothetical protein